MNYRKLFFFFIYLKDKDISIRRVSVFILSFYSLTTKKYCKKTPKHFIYLKKKKPKQWIGWFVQYTNIHWMLSVGGANALYSDVERMQVMSNKQHLSYPRWEPVISCCCVSCVHCFREISSSKISFSLSLLSYTFLFSHTRNGYICYFFLSFLWVWFSSNKTVCEMLSTHRSTGTFFFVFFCFLIFL